MQMTCPCCHAIFPLEAANQDEAARELLVMKGNLHPRVWRALISYLGLFRSKSRALSWDRSLRLAQEVMDLNADPECLETALAETVEALRLKGGPPLKNHNYLKRVIETAAVGPATVPSRERETKGAAPAGGKRAAALKALSEWGREDWLHGEISVGLQALVAQSLKNQPGADTITFAADVWHVALKKSLDIPDVDVPRIRKAWEKLFQTVTEWPAPKQLIALLPSRPPRMSLDAPKPSEEQIEAGKRGVQGLRNYRSKGGEGTEGT